MNTDVSTHTIGATRSKRKLRPTDRPFSVEPNDEPPAQALPSFESLGCEGSGRTPKRASSGEVNETVRAPTMRGMCMHPAATDIRLGGWAKAGMSRANTGGGGEHVFSLVGITENGIYYRFKACFDTDACSEGLVWKLWHDYESFLSIDDKQYGGMEAWIEHKRKQLYGDRLDVECNLLIRHTDITRGNQTMSLEHDAKHKAGIPLLARESGQQPASPPGCLSSVASVVLENGLKQLRSYLCGVLSKFRTVEYTLNACFERRVRLSFLREKPLADVEYFECWTAMHGSAEDLVSNAFPENSV